VHLVESTALLAGVGEPGAPPFAPALCNAIRRHRQARAQPADLEARPVLDVNAHI
jgi:CO/xanthine dehydrogenase Mo-binding subunit